MAKMLVETLAGDYDPDEFEDDYAKAIEAVVSAKLEGGEVKHTSAPEPSGGEVVDLLAALQKSVDAAKQGRGETASDADAADDGDEKPAKKTASKKSASSASKKSTAKKAPAKKAPAKETTAKKSAAKSTAKKSAAKKTAAKKTTRKAS